MFSYITGTIASIKTDAVVLENNGIGYHIYIPQSDLIEFDHIGQKIKIHTYFQVSENGMALYGFLTEEELDLFELLLTVNGVGPKAAVAILGVLNADDLKFAILSDDEASITKAPGIGVKSAKRIILDLKDKIDTAFLSAPKEQSLFSEDSCIDHSVRNDAILALSSLGFSSTDAFKAMNDIEISPETTTEELIKEALRKLTAL